MFAPYQVADWGQGMVLHWKHSASEVILSSWTLSFKPALTASVSFFESDADNGSLCERKLEYFFSVSLVRWPLSASELSLLLGTDGSVLMYYPVFGHLVVVNMKWLSVFLPFCYISVCLHIKHWSSLRSFPECQFCLLFNSKFLITWKWRVTMVMLR